MILLGLLLLIAAAIVGVIGVLTNLGAAASFAQFTMFGFPVNGTTGTLFLFGLIVGAVGMLGMAIMFAGLGRRRRVRRELRGTRREAEDLRKRHDKLSEDLENERAQRASTQPSNDTATSETTDGPASARPPEQRSAADQPTSLRDRLHLGQRKAKG